MSKITFRADDDLVRQLEAYDASKSEVMREALRAYLAADDQKSTSSDPADADTDTASTGEESIDELLVERVDAVLADRVDAMLADRLQSAVTPREPPDVNVNITLDGHADAVNADAKRKTSRDGQANREDSDSDPEHGESRDSCKQCGERLSDGAVYCSNCGEKASHRVFCECGDELRSDWGFCPSCGRRTPAADVLRDP